MTNLEIINRIKSFITDSDFVYYWKTDKWYSYYILWKYVFYISLKLDKINKQKIIAVMQNGLDLFCLLFAALISNITIVLIDPLKAKKEIDYIISENNDAYIVNDNDDLFHDNDKGNDFSKEILLKKINNINIEKIYLITYTSGTSGNPKGVCHNFYNLIKTSCSFASAVDLNSNYTMCHVMPMTYMAGILNTIFMPFICGCKIAIMPRFDVLSAVSFWKKAEASNSNAFWLSPTMLNILLTIDKKGKAKEYLRKIKPLFFIGTSPLYSNIRDEFEKRYEVKLLQSYGLSETLFLTTEIPDIENDKSSVGNILSGVKLELSQDNEIIVEVPWMFLGYNNRSQNDISDNKYYTGDLGKIENDKLYIIGRKKDLIIKGGLNISPKQIEDVVLQSGFVAECAISSVVYNNEERIVCWYVCSEKIENCEEELNKYIETNLGKHCKVDYFKKINEIPKNLNGKTDKKVLVRDFKI